MSFDVARMKRLRKLFLDDRTRGEGLNRYWRDREDLQAYDETLGTRIGWKWQAVMDELKQRAWKGPSADVAICDWGCGGGVASRVFAESFGVHERQQYYFFDHSPLAQSFAKEEFLKEHPSAKVIEGRPATLASEGGPFFLLVSHVVNELSNSAAAELEQLLARSEGFIWVEAGSFNESRALVEIREKFKSKMQVVAPCTHTNRCGMLSPENERHWCHNFARVPSEVFSDSEWMSWAREMGVDLRSLPYSFLVMEKPRSAEGADAKSPAVIERLIGRPRHYKGFAKLLSCGHEGVRDLMLQKRDKPELFKDLKDCDGETPLYEWELNEKQVIVKAKATSC